MAKKPSNKAKLMSETHLSSDEDVPTADQATGEDKSATSGFVNVFKDRAGNILNPNNSRPTSNRHLCRRMEVFPPRATIPVVWELPVEADALLEQYPWLNGVYMMLFEAMKLKCRNDNPAKKDPDLSAEEIVEALQYSIDGIQYEGKWYKEGEATKRRTKTRILAECFLELGLAKTKNLEELEEYFKQVHPKEKKTIGEMVLHPTSKYEEVRQLYKEKTEKKASNFDASDLELDI